MTEGTIGPAEAGALLVGANRRADSERHPRRALGTNNSGAQRRPALRI